MILTWCSFVWQVNPPLRIFLMMKNSWKRFESVLRAYVHVMKLSYKFGGKFVYLRVSWGVDQVHLRSAILEVIVMFISDLVWVAEVLQVHDVIEYLLAQVWEVWWKEENVLPKLSYSCWKLDLHTGVVVSKTLRGQWEAIIYSLWEIVVILMVVPVGEFSLDYVHISGVLLAFCDVFCLIVLLKRLGKFIQLLKGG